MSKNLEEYKQMEELYIKYNKNDITSAERLRLGKFLIEKYDAVDSYKVLKPFIEEKNVDALFAKAQYLELEGELKEAMSIYKELYKTYKHTKSAIKLLQNSDVSTISKRKENIELINQIPHFDKPIYILKMMNGLRQKKYMINLRKWSIYLFIENLENIMKIQEIHIIL